MKKLNDQELHERVKTLVIEERNLTKTILENIAEVDRRRLFLKMVYASLFEYLTLGIGYSAGAAQRRIDAARLSQVIPEVLDQVEQGKLHLSQISKLQKVCRIIKKEKGESVSPQLKKQVLEKIENCNSDQTDLVLSDVFQVQLKVAEKASVQRDESVRIELTLTKEEMDLLNQARDLLSNKTGGGLKATVIELADRVVQKSKVQISNTSKVQVYKKSETTSVKKMNFTAIAAVEAELEAKSEIGVEIEGKVKMGIEMEIKAKQEENSTAIMSSETEKSEGDNSKSQEKVCILKTITPRLKREILGRDMCCQFRDKKTGKMCGSTFYLEVDHIQPRHLNGYNSDGNLKALCKNHNLYRYQAGL